MTAYLSAAQIVDHLTQLLAARGRVGHRWQAPVVLDPGGGAVYGPPPQVKVASVGSAMNPTNGRTPVAVFRS